MRPTNLPTRNWKTVAMLACAVQCIAGVVSAGTIVLGIADGVAVDQPRVDIGIEDPANLGVLVGPELYNSAVLDTGANGIMLAQLSYIWGEQYDTAKRADTSTVQYYETGVAGGEWLDLLKPYHLNYQGTDAVTRIIENANIIAAPNLDAGSFCGIVGMPAMVGRVVQMDLRTILNPVYLEVNFHDTLPAAAHPASSYTVPLIKLPIQFTDAQQPGDPRPTYSPAPLLNVGHVFGGNTEYQSVLLDTGAQTSIISQAMADRLGINLDPSDPNNHIVDLDGNGIIDADDYMAVGGIGGTVMMLTTQLDSIRIPTASGDDLVLTNVQVGVLDITGVDGVLGMNILTSGYGDLIFDPDRGDKNGYFEQVMLDFTGENWTMRLDVNPAFVPEPTSLAVVTLGAGFLMRRRSRAAVACA